ncbi:hypothetical protein J6590_024789 [Homalodisca vitripennis]|nr:hypothetical protein J6590_098898 [Homalodisca vitripennis]KAG8317562.1 hypothetical protein J6590_024789 [Homalodisca vitripennis]
MHKRREECNLQQLCSSSSQTAGYYSSDLNHPLVPTAQTCERSATYSNSAAVHHKLPQLCSSSSQTAGYYSSDLNHPLLTTAQTWRGVQPTTILQQFITNCRLQLLGPQPPISDNCTNVERSSTY